MQPASLEELVLRSKKNKPKRLIVVAADDLHVLSSVKKAVHENIIVPVLIGNSEKIFNLAKKLNFEVDNFEIINIPDTIEASKYAVNLIKENKAEILMKGMVPTAILMKEVLNKKHGIHHSGLLSHYTILELKTFHKLLSISDVALNISPGLDEKKIIIHNSLNVMQKLGYTNPKIAILCPIEIVNPKIESTVHADVLKKMWLNNEITDCIIDGPLALDNAISKEAASIKKIPGTVAGDADLLIVPDLNSGNILYKSLCYLAEATSAAIITGGIVPIVLTSRTDSERSKYYSIALAACM